MIKSFLKSDFAHQAAAAGIRRYIQLVESTSPRTVINAESPSNYWKQNQPFILCFWHSRLMMVPRAWRGSGRQIRIAISRHRDGDLIANAVAPLGVGAIRGSAANPDKPDVDKGGRAALLAMVRDIKAGHCVGVTPDGPRGPARRASLGAVRLAALTGAPMIPFAFAASRAKTMRSWDKFHLALPFAHGYYVWGDPIHAPKDGDDATMDSARLQLESALNAVTDDADDRASAQPQP